MPAVSDTSPNHKPYLRKAEFVTTTETITVVGAEPTDNKFSRCSLVNWIKHSHFVHVPQTKISEVIFGDFSAVKLLTADLPTVDTFPLTACPPGE